MRQLRQKRRRSACRRRYGSYEALLDDPAVQVVHNATPNYLHYPVNAAAIAKGKHVVSDKPLAMTAAEAKKLLDQATKAGIVHAVTFNYRGNPLVQQARHAIARGDIGKPNFLSRPLPAGLAAQGHRLLMAPRARQGRRVLGARRHRIALVRPRAAHQRPADHRGAGRHHDRDPETEEAEGLARGVRRRRRQRGVRARRHQGRGSGVGAAALRQRRARELLGRPGVRRAQERPASRDLRLEGVAALAPGAPERAVDRPPRQGQRDPAEGSGTDRRRGPRLRAPARRPPGSRGPTPSAT